MCLMVYLAADEPLPLVAWNDTEPAFHVAATAPDEERVRTMFSKEHVVYAGSYEGCGCGFQYGEVSAQSVDPLERKKRRRSLDELGAYLSRELPRVGPIEIYVCWDGDQDSLPEHRRNLTPASLKAETFFFMRKELSTVTPEPAATP
jgi:hypothetical protein